MILDILLISAMSDESERVFLETHHIVSWDRVQISAKTFEYVEYLKHWKQNEILKK